jgi:hypothetical protein
MDIAFEVPCFGRANDAMKIDGVNGHASHHEVKSWIGGWSSGRNYG